MAIFIARQCGATITGVYSLSIPSRSEFGRVGRVDKSVNKEIEEFMDEAKNKAAKQGIVFTKKILKGDVGYNIVKMAQNKNDKFDLIVIGSRGRGTVKELFLGSTSNYVIHASKVPILLVK